MTFSYTGGDFAYAPGPCLPTVAAGASCTIYVDFTPTSLGPQTSSIIITDNAPGSPHTISLSGTRVAP